MGVPQSAQSAGFGPYLTSWILRTQLIDRANPPPCYQGAHQCRAFLPLQVIWTRLWGTVRFHDLRHTAASLMLSRGVHPKVASELLGHATVGITLDLYSHVSESMQREAARAMDDLLTPG